MAAMSLFALFGGLLFPIVFVLMIVAAVRAIVVTVRVPPRVAREPSCEVCGYRVAGLTALTCPECGTDLRATGIITLPMEVKRRGSLVGAITAWLFLMSIAGGMGASVISLLQVAPMMAATASTSTTTTTPLTPASGAYQRIDVINTMSFATGSSVCSNEIDLVLADGSVWKAVLPFRGNSYTIISPDQTETTTSPDDGNAADNLFKSSGLNTADSRISAENREVTTIVGVLGYSPTMPANMMRLRTFTAGAPVVTGAPMAAGPLPQSAMFFIALAVGAVLWLALLILGIMFIVSRRRRLLKQYATVRTPGGTGLPPGAGDPAATNSPAATG
jgi:hypothetical protein